MLSVVTTTIQRLLRLRSLRCILHKLSTARLMSNSRVPYVAADARFVSLCPCTQALATPAGPVGTLGWRRHLLQALYHIGTHFSPARACNSLSMWDQLPVPCTQRRMVETVPCTRVFVRTICCGRCETTLHADQEHRLPTRLLLTCRLTMACLYSSTCDLLHGLFPCMSALTLLLSSSCDSAVTSSRESQDVSHFFARV